MDIGDAADSELQQFITGLEHRTEEKGVHPDLSVCRRSFAMANI